MVGVRRNEGRPPSIEKHPALLTTGTLSALDAAQVWLCCFGLRKHSQLDRRHGMPCEPELLPSGRILNVLVFELASVMEVRVYSWLRDECGAQTAKPALGHPRCPASKAGALAGRRCAAHAAGRLRSRNELHHAIHIGGKQRNSCEETAERTTKQEQKAAGWAVTFVSSSSRGRRCFLNGFGARCCQVFRFRNFDLQFSPLRTTSRHPKAGAAARRGGCLLCNCGERGYHNSQLWEPQQIGSIKQPNTRFR